ncbi:MAG: 50S ribosomal protein L35 [Caldisericia bacterium]|nr:50S ribosomal protein L35 [Caldisericia bacterium]NLI56051.1 50S ribosomal protein L35 [bacterium]
MPKLKISKTAKKRFKVTGSGKVMRRKTGHSHHLEKKKSSKKVKQLRYKEISKEDEKKVRKIIGLRR